MSNITKFIPLRRKQLVCILFLTLSNFCIAQKDKTIATNYFPIRDSLYMVTIGFTNIGILVGEKELILVDASKKSFMDSARDSLLLRFGNKPVKYILNTHSHGDHTGGNPKFMKEGTICIAHINAKKEMHQIYYVDENGKQVDSIIGKPFREYEEHELPQITFNDKMELSVFNEDVELMHVADAHTRGDVIIFFKRSNVIALGDNYFGDAYTFGNNIEGMIKVYKFVLTIIDDNTIILPGHGKLSNKQELQQYLNMITHVKSKIDLLKSQGKKLEDIKADKSITEMYDAKYGKLYINGEQFRELLYNGGNKK